MPTPADCDPAPDGDTHYRRGYAQGAQALAEALAGRLSGHEQALIDQWITALERWQSSATGEAADPPAVPAL